MMVIRVSDATGSHIEPPLEQHWDDLTKLRWHAAVVAHGTGLSITIHDGARSDRDGNPIRGYYSVTVGPGSISAFDYQSAWNLLTGIGMGAEAAIRAVKAPG